eukprot:scaffold229907_cov39-Prasinocladus_malaysianus.AAC.1
MNISLRVSEAAVGDAQHAYRTADDRKDCNLVVRSQRYGLWTRTRTNSWAKSANLPNKSARRVQLYPPVAMGFRKTILALGRGGDGAGNKHQVEEKDFQTFIYPKSVSGLPEYFYGHKLALRWLDVTGGSGARVGHDGSATWTRPVVLTSNIALKCFRQRGLESDGTVAQNKVERLEVQ